MPRTPGPRNARARPARSDAHGAELTHLRRLAAACGIQARYTDGLGQVRRPPPESLIAILAALSHPVRSPRDAARALERLRHQRQREMLPPVIIAWNGDAPRVRAQLPANVRAIEWSLALEDGAGEYRASQDRTGAGPFLLRLPRGIPTGYHTLAVEAGRHRAVASVLSAPSHCYDPDDHAKPTSQRRELGVFLPLYAARSRRDWGAGDLRELEALTAWAGRLGCNLVGTLPLLACFLDEPFEPSPYAPVSRLHFNELYADVSAAPERRSTPAMQRLTSAASFKQELSRLRNADLVDYRAAWAAKKRALSALSQTAWNNPRRRQAMEHMLGDVPTLREYAAFRATIDRHHRGWPAWPARQREGQLRPSDYDARDFQRHIYSQFLMREQLAEQSRLAAHLGGRLYLDLPLGTHGAGFDLWRFREHFAPGLATGAPPDLLFTHGQNWGFPPLHPERARLLGHAYFAAAIRNHLRFAGALRIDHIAGLHRVFCIPQGMEGDAGAYISYPHDELYAVLSIESHRARARIVGENLGTVPREVTRTMEERSVLGMWVGQFNIGNDPARSAAGIRPANLACLNTHDMPPFAAHWRGHDIDFREQMGWLDEDSARREREGRRRWSTAVLASLRAAGLLKRRAMPAPQEVALALMMQLARSDAEIVLVNLEDLWGESRSQNVPGTTDQHTNWQRKSTRTLESIARDRRLAAALRALARARARISPARARRPANVQRRSRTRKQH